MGIAHTTLRRAPNLIVREVGGEVVIFNTRTSQATALSGFPLAAWRAATDGAVLPAASDEEIDAAFANLLELGLLEAPGMSRRTLLARGGTVAAIAGIATIGVPTVAMAASGKKTPVVGIATGNANPGAGATYTVTVTVSAPTPGTDPNTTGNVSVVDSNGTVVAGPSALLAGNPSTRQFAITNGAGTTPTVLHAVYAGDNNYVGGSSTTITENAYTVTLSYALSNTKKNVADTVTVTATVSGGGLAALSGETVTLSGSDAAISGTGTFNTTGTATIAITNPKSSGTYTFQLDYAGDTTHAASTFKNTSQTITN